MKLFVTGRISSMSMPSIRETFLDITPLVVVEDVKDAPHASRAMVLEMNRRALTPSMLLHQQQERITP